MDNQCLRCAWREQRGSKLDRCLRVATTCVIYGCLEGHINEIMTCDQHLMTWEYMFANSQEPCSKSYCFGSIDTWIHLAASDLTSGFRLYMMTRQ
jgi:hypothetical protein